MNSDFQLSGCDVFGRYVKIPTGYSKELHIYKVIQKLKSNYYCDVPLTYDSENNCHTHSELTDVLNVIHCGCDENKVVRVAMKDVKFISNPNHVPFYNTHKGKFIQLLDDINIDYTETSDGIELDHTALEGDGYLFIKFYDDNEFQEFIAYPG